MLRALKELGEYLKEKEGKGGLEDRLGDISDRKKFISIDFARKKKNNNKYEYDGVSVLDLEGGDYSPKDSLYKYYHSVSPDYTPTSKVTRIYSYEEYEKASKNEDMKNNDTLSLKTGKWYEKNYSDHAMVRDAKKELEKKERVIRNELKKEFKPLSPDDVVLTIRYEDENGEMKLIGKYKFFREKLKDNIAEKWEKKHNETSISNDEKCILCHKNKKVFGFAFPLKLYAISNARYAPNLDQSQSWKNLPLCKDCAFDLEIAVSFLESESFSFYIGERLEYYVVPDFPLDGPKNDEVMNLILEGTAKSEKSFLDAEKYYREYIETNYPLNLDFVFYQKDNNSQTIEKYVEDVSPSWIKKSEKELKRAYNDTYQSLDLDKIDSELKKEKNDPKNLEKLGNLIYRVLPSAYGSSTYNNTTAYLNDALDLTEKILKGEQIEYERLLRLFDKEILSRFRQNDNYKGYVGRIFLFLNFLTKIGLLSSKGEDKMKNKNFEDIINEWADPDNEKLSEFFNEFPKAFNKPEKRAIFLEGVMAQHLMDVQSILRNSDEPPFRKKMSNLRLDIKRAKRLLPEIFNMLDIYNSKSDFPVEYRKLREITSTYFAKAEENEWNISDEELRYFFTLGMSLNRNFKSNRKGSKSDTESK